MASRRNTKTGGNKMKQKLNQEVWKKWKIKKDKEVQDWFNNHGHTEVSKKLKPLLAKIGKIELEWADKIKPELDVFRQKQKKQRERFAKKNGVPK